MAGVVLTQLLYEKTEVTLSLMTSIVKRKPVAEVLFWVAELSASGCHDELWATLWCVYFDFYAASHPLLAAQLAVWHRAYLDSPGYGPAARAAQNLHVRHPRSEAFEARMHAQDHGDVSPRTFSSLEQLWTHGSLMEVAAFLRDSTLEQQAVLVRSVQGAFPKSVLPGYHDGLRTNQKHWVLAAVLCGRVPRDEVATSLLLVDVSADTIESMGDIGSFDDTSDYYYLCDRRCYATDKRIGCFMLPRFDLTKPLTEHLWFHWEYHAMQCPLWARRLRKHGVVGKSEAMAVEYPDEAAEEAFFSDWNILPDEQPATVQAAASGQIVAVKYSRWFRETFCKCATLEVRGLVRYLP
jgi:hypothetical protein